MKTKLLILSLAAVLTVSFAFAISDTSVKADCPKDTLIVGETTHWNALIGDETIYNPITISDGEAAVSGPLQVSSTPSKDCEVTYGTLQ